MPSWYRGTISVTKYGIECQKWTDQFPHSHTKTPDNPIFANKGLGDHNYCRNPDGEPEGAWCYTTDPNVRWEYCSYGKSKSLTQRAAKRKENFQKNFFPVNFAVLEKKIPVIANIPKK